MPKEISADLFKVPAPTKFMEDGGIISPTTFAFLSEVMDFSVN